MNEVDSNSKEERHTPRIQRPPHKWHTLTQTIGIKFPRSDSSTNTLHLVKEHASSGSRLRIQLTQHTFITEHIRQSPIGLLEMCAGEGSENSNVE